MKKECRDYILSILPLLLIPIDCVVIIIFFKIKIILIIGGILIPILLVVEGLVFIFKKNIFYKNYYCKKEKIIYGIGWIGLGVFLLLKILGII